MNYNCIIRLETERDYRSSSVVRSCNTAHELLFMGGVFDEVRLIVRWGRRPCPASSGQDRPRKCL